MSLLILSCNGENKSKEIEYLTDILSFDDCSTQAQKPSTENLILYYFDADCSLCYAKMKALEEFAQKMMPKTQCLFIGHTTNRFSVLSNLKRINIQSCMTLDEDNEFYLKNERIIAENNVFLIKRNGEIILKGDPTTSDEIYEQFLNQK